MEATKLIKQDHRAVKALFRKFQKATGQPEQQELADEIIRELSIHASVEEQLVYPALRSRETRFEAHVLDALEEHHAVKVILGELDEMNVGDERFEAKMHVVRELVESHIEEEEQKLLPRFEKLFDAEERALIADAIVELKGAVPTHPEPDAPDTPPEGQVAAMAGKLSEEAQNLIRSFTSRREVEVDQRVRERPSKTGAGPAKRGRRENGRRGATAH
jgi:hypothetical protein